MKKEKGEVDEMIAIMSGVPLQQKVVPREDRVIKERDTRPEENFSDIEEVRKEKKKYPFNAEPFKKYHEDDEIYINKKKDDNRGGEDRDPLDWGPPPPKFQKPKKDKIPNKSNVDANKKR
jgi:hypothetical protein